jgi:hypothetical protein
MLREVKERNCVPYVSFHDGELLPCATSLLDS